MMKVIIIQPDIKWEDRKSNILKYYDYFMNIQKCDIIVLPEMFTTGFTMNPKLHYETMYGETISWMKFWASKIDTAICGSLVIKDSENYYNRFVFVKPDGSVEFYDKRHLFSLGKEDKFYERGIEQKIIEWRGFKILPIICYDLRFPVWSRYTSDNEYDMMICVANWPESRSIAWKTLLKSRAIENQSFVIGCNRIGLDGNGINHSGDSMIIGPIGEILSEPHNDIIEYELDIDYLKKTRNDFQFLNDGDLFKVSI